jgi:hypothetical protein
MPDESTNPLLTKLRDAKILFEEECKNIESQKDKKIRHSAETTRELLAHADRIRHKTTSFLEDAEKTAKNRRCRVEEELQLIRYLKMLFEQFNHILIKGIQDRCS